MRRVLIVTVCLALAGATPALAGLDPGNGELGFDLGYARLEANASDEDRTGAARFNFRGGYCFNKMFELEGMGAGLGSEDPGAGTATTTLAVDFVDAVFNFHPTNVHIVPYVLVGTGYATLIINPDFGDRIEESGAAFQIAGGSRFFYGVKKRVAFRVELSAISEDTFDKRQIHVSLTGGFTWRLGGQK